MSKDRSSNNAAISVNNVSKVFQLPHEKTTTVKGMFTGFSKRGLGTDVERQQALEDISFDIKEGEFFGVVGRNGSGKSTLLKILAGIYQPTTGSVDINGRLVPFIELGVGFNPDLTGKENVYLNGGMLGFSQKQMEAMYDDIVEFAELGRFMDQKLKNYSSGMQVRLAFSVAIKADADILLVDEVLAVGDADFQRKCFDYFRSLKKSKRTVVFVSHEMTAIREFCDRALLIEDSKKVEEGEPDRIARLYSQLFIDDSDQEGQTFESEEEQDRWGDGRVSFTNVALNKRTLDDTDEYFTVTTTIKAHKDCEHLVVGTAIKGSTGDAIFGTNTQEKQMNIKKINKDEEVTLTWEYPNILADGKYTIDVAIHGTDGQSVADWWNDAVAFRVKRVDHSPYHVAPKIGLQKE